MIDAGLKAQRALFQLAQLLIAKGHVQENLEGYHLVSVALWNVYDIKDSVRFLKQE